MTTVVRLVVVPTIAAGVATLLSPSWLEHPGIRTRAPTVPVVVAAREIAEGRVIDSAAVTVAQWPVVTVPAGVYASVDSVIGRVARVTVFKGEALRPGRLANGIGAGVDTRIMPGKRAFSLRIDNAAGNAGTIQPNSRVDILITLNERGDGNDRIAKIFMSNLRVLAIGSHVQRGADGRATAAHVATLEVTLEEAERLAIAAAQGALSLVLRGYGDPDSATTTGATTADVVSTLRRNRVGMPHRPDTLAIKSFRGRNPSPISERPRSEP